MDPLTGLPNRRGFDEVFTLVSAEPEPWSMPTSTGSRISMTHWDTRPATRR